MTSSRQPQVASKKQTWYTYLFNLYCFNIGFAVLIIIMTVGPPRQTVFIIKYLKDPNDFLISLQESAAPGFTRPLLSAVGPYNGSDPRAHNAIMRAGLGGAADSLTLDEIAALERDYSSDGTASTVSLDIRQPYSTDIY